MVPLPAPADSATFVDSVEVLGLFSEIRESCREQEGSELIKAGFDYLKC